MHKQRKHLRVVPLSPTCDKKENTMNSSHQNTPLLCEEFQHGKMISHFVLEGHRTYHFYCLDGDTTTVINILAKTISFPVWETKTEEVWFHSDHNICISRTPHGWFASRQYPTGNRQLTHRGLPLPILFPTPELAQAAVELCLPNAHPALNWSTNIEKRPPAKISERASPLLVGLIGSPSFMRTLGATSSRPSQSFFALYACFRPATRPPLYPDHGRCILCRSYSFGTAPPPLTNPTRRIES
jgi:hypothetical protein